jgi:hypothetical protein
MPTNLPKPVARVFSLRQAILVALLQPFRVCINVRTGDPPMPAPWEPRMGLDGATLYVHPAHERWAMWYLASLP